MPTLSQFLEATVPVPIQCGDVTITLHGRVERVTASGKNGDEYRALQKDDNRIQIEIGEAMGQIESALTDVGALNVPSPERFGDFAGLARAFVETVRAHAAGEDQVDLIEQARMTDEAVASFERELLPTAEEVARKQKAAEDKAKKASEKIDVLRGKRFDNFARRIVFLTSKWDLTEGEEPDAPMVPVTFETVRGFSEGFLVQALEQLEKKALAYSRTTSASTS